MTAVNITDEMVEAVAKALTDTSNPAIRRRMARAALEAAAPLIAAQARAELLNRLADSLPDNEGALVIALWLRDVVDAMPTTEGGE